MSSSPEVSSHAEEVEKNNLSHEDNLPQLSKTRMKKMIEQLVKVNKEKARQSAVERKGSENELLTDPSISTISFKDNYLSLSYFNFENMYNLCWLDSSMSLLAHNKKLWNAVKQNPKSQIASIIESYKEAICFINDDASAYCIEERFQRAIDTLHFVQTRVLSFLGPKISCREGAQDSAFCCLLNLIIEIEEIKDLFDVEFTWIRSCDKCSSYRPKIFKKPIITVPKVDTTFLPSSPVSLFNCTSCQSENQKVNLKFKTLPQILMFHFENGTGHGDNEFTNLDFEVHGRKYKLSGLIAWERVGLKNSEDTTNHFTTWIRDTATDRWLECNDLSTNILRFSVVPPAIKLKDLYIIMYEAQDNKGTISNKLFVEDSSLMVDLKEDFVECIDISDSETVEDFDIGPIKNSTKEETITEETSPVKYKISTLNVPVAENLDLVRDQNKLLIDILNIDEEQPAAYFDKGILNNIENKSEETMTEETSIKKITSLNVPENQNTNFNQDKDNLLIDILNVDEEQPAACFDKGILNNIENKSEETMTEETSIKKITSLNVPENQNPNFNRDKDKLLIKIFKLKVDEEQLENDMLDHFLEHQLPAKKKRKSKTHNNNNCDKCLMKVMTGAMEQIAKLDPTNHLKFF